MNTRTKNSESAFAGSEFFFVMGFEVISQQSCELLLQPVQTLAATSIFAAGENADESRHSDHIECS